MSAEDLLVLSDTRTPPDLYKQLVESRYDMSCNFLDDEKRDRLVCRPVSLYVWGAVTPEGVVAAPVSVVHFVLSEERGGKIVPARDRAIISGSLFLSKRFSKFGEYSLSCTLPSSSSRYVCDAIVHLRSSDDRDFCDVVTGNARYMHERLDAPDVRVVSCDVSGNVAKVRMTVPVNHHGVHVGSDLVYDVAGGVVGSYFVKRYGDEPLEKVESFLRDRLKSSLAEEDVDADVSVSISRSNGVVEWDVDFSNLLVFAKYNVSFSVEVRARTPFDLIRALDVFLQSSSL